MALYVNFKHSVEYLAESGSFSGHTYCEMALFHITHRTVLIAIILHRWTIFLPLK